METNVDGIFLNKELIYEKLYEKDDNEREINIYKLNNVKLTGENIFYPNCLLCSMDNLVYNPIDEKIMSLQVDRNYSGKIDKKFCNTENFPVFYFIYNLDNYYHFVYDTLPYLISYKHLKEKMPNLKLLTNYSNYQFNKFYPFVIEFLKILNIYEDILLADNYTLYKEVYISSSYTHGINSNKPPRKEIYSFYNKLTQYVCENYKIDKYFPENIYISRRTKMHNNFDNIGTNYTNKRKLENEDELVDYLENKGFTEIFTENLTTIEKIKLFANAKNVIGAIGGGLCNVLFSSPDTTLTCIISPTFLEINSRFIFSLNKVNTNYVYDTEHVDKNEWKKYMRVKVDNIIGEIEEIYQDSLLISYVDKFVAGWNSQMNTKKDVFPKNKCQKLDNGLNSPWILNIDSINI